MKLALLHPVVAGRACDDCRRWIHDDKGPGRFGLPLLRADKPIPRPPGTNPPCKMCPKIPPGAPPVPESAVELSPELRAAWSFYRECRAVGSFPSDPWVRRCASVIRSAEDQVERIHQQRGQLSALESLLSQVGYG